MKREQLVFPLALGIFFVSGFAALLYQVIWQRILGLFSGTDVYSVTIIVAAYMAGLGIGNLVGGYVADRFSRWGNLFLFALAEFSIGIFALISKNLYYDWLYQQHIGLASSPVMMAAVLLFSLLWPTFFMGVSLPALARAMTSSISNAPRTIGTLYGINTLGSAVGALITTWIFLRFLGFESILRIGAALNIVVALSALPLGWILHSQRQTETAFEQSPASSATTNNALPQLRFPVWALIYMLSGFIALSLEIVWFRLLGIMLKSTGFTFGTLLAIYLGGLALGSFIATGTVKYSRQPTRVFLVLQSLISVYALLSLTLLVSIVNNVSALNWLWLYFGNPEPMQVASMAIAIYKFFTGTLIHKQALASFIGIYVLLPMFLVGPPTLLMGLSFPYLQKVVQNNPALLGRRVGWLQTANIIGSMFGAIIAGWMSLSLVGSLGTLRGLVILAGIFLLLLVRSQLSKSMASRYVGYIATVICVLFISVLVPDTKLFWARLHGTEPDRIIFAEDNTGLSLLKSLGSAFTDGTLVISNGLGQSIIPYGNIHSVLGALPALIHPNPEDIAIIGLGSGDTTFHAGGRQETKCIDSIEIAGTQLKILREMARLQNYPALTSLLNDQRLHHIIADGRSYIQQQSKKYDIIEADALRPTSAYSGNLYSEEYFQMLLYHLKPGGYAVSWVPTKRVYNTFIKIFPYFLMLNDEIIIGSNQPVLLNIDLVHQRLIQPFTRNYYSKSSVDIRLMLDELMNAKKTSIKESEDSRSSWTDTNSDLFPKDEYQIPFNALKVKAGN